MSLRELFDKYQWRSTTKFVSLAKRHGFNESEAKRFIRNEAPHDIKSRKPQFQKIVNKYGSQRPSYQFDTLIQQKGAPFLIFININTRKGYAYKMSNKGKDSVLDALKHFIRDAPDVAILTSDRDKAYLSDGVLRFLAEHHIEYHTTHNNNHNILGIINRFIRTLRDMNNESSFTEERMKELIDEYNNSPHRGIGETPNDMTSEKETSYVRNAIQQNKTKITLKEGDRVRVIQDKNPLMKRRSNLSNESYIIDDRDRNQMIIRAKDGSIDNYPPYRLVKADKRYKLAETIRNKQQGIVDKILDYDEKKDKYKVIYDEGTKDTIPSKNLRESEPNKLSTMEIDYWSKQPKLPERMRQYV